MFTITADKRPSSLNYDANDNSSANKDSESRA